jgi:hypothetical protein
MLRFDGRPEGGNYDHIVGINFWPVDQLASIGIHNKLDTPTLEIFIYFLIVYHLAQKKNLFASIFFQSLIAYFDCIFDSITKAEMTREIEFNRSKIKKCRLKVLFAQILDTAWFFDLSGYRRPEVRRDFEFFDSNEILRYPKGSGKS